MTILFNVEGHIAWLTINRPHVMNAMDAATYRELSDAWTEVRDNPDIRVAIITGAGEKAFSAGRDLKTSAPATPQMHELWHTQQELTLNRGMEIWKPVIAAVNGYCLAGGMTILLATDIRIAAEGATFGLPEVKWGIIGGTQRALRQLPYPVAMELLLIGDRIDAREALRIGLINRVVPQAELMTTAYDYAAKLAANPPLTVQAIKELAVRSQGMHLNDGLRLERLVEFALQQTQDRKEGIRAFVEKRRPVYQGR